MFSYSPWTRRRNTVTSARPLKKQRSEKTRLLASEGDMKSPHGCKCRAPVVLRNKLARNLDRADHGIRSIFRVSSGGFRAFVEWPMTARYWSKAASCEFDHANHADRQDRTRLASPPAFLHPSVNAELMLAKRTALFPRTHPAAWRWDSIKDHRFGVLNNLSGTLTVLDVGSRGNHLAKPDRSDEFSLLF